MSNQILISSGAKLRDLDDVIIGTDGVLSSLAFNVANGVPKLDENGKILVSQLPNSVMEFKGVWNAATNTPTLANGTGNAGDVYLCNVAGTVDFGAGPIAFAVGDYAVYTGTVWARSSGATGTVTSVGVSRDGNALAITGSPITTSGTINLGFSGDNTQYINGAGNLTTFPTLITSIGLTMPAAFNVSNSPLTANGTIGVTAAGYPSQYIRGDGTLADFPTSGGGGSSVSYYFNGGTSQGTIGGTTYYQMSKTANTGAGVDFSKSGDGLITAFLTDAGDPALLQIPAGNWNYEIYASMSANGGTPELYAELYVYNGTTFTLISTSTNEILYDGTNLNLYTFAMAVPETTLTVTDRLAIKLYSTNSGGKTTTVHTQNGHLCQVITTFTTGLTALNGLTAQVQYFGTGTSGSDFNIVSSVDTHTFNLPTASATKRGALSSADWSTFNNKQNALTLTTTGSSGAATLISNTLNIPNYTLAGLGGVPTTRTLTINSVTYDLSADRTWTITAGISSVSGTAPISVSTVGGAATVSIATANTTTTGALSSTDWNTFNGKQNALTLTTTGASGASTLVGSTLNVPTYTLAGLGGQPLATNLTSLSSLTFASTSFVKMTATGTFSLDTNTYVSSAALNGYLPLTAGSTKPLTGDLYISSNEPQIWLSKTGTDAGSWRILGSTGGDLRRFRIYDNVAEADRFIVFSSGNVGINTTTDAGFKFDVIGTSRINSAAAALTLSNAADVWLRIIRGTVFNNIGIDATGAFYNTNSSHRFFTADGTITALTIADTGAASFVNSISATSSTISKSSNSGSGSIFPRLSVKNTLATQGDGTSTFNFADINISSGNEAVNMFISTTYAAGTWAPAGIINVSTNHDLQIKTNNTTRLLVTNGGNLGVSSSANYAKLQVESTGTTSYFRGGDGGYAALAFSGNNGTLVGVLTTFGGLIYFGRSNGALGTSFGAQSDLCITSGGNILINTGTDAGQKFQVSGEGLFSSSVFIGNGTLKMAGNSVYNWMIQNYNDANWGFGMFNSGSQYYPTVYFSGDGTADRGFRVRNVNGGTNVFLVTSTGVGTFSSNVYATGFYESSDMRLKTLIEDNYLLSSIANVKAKLYIKDGRKELGYYAQDLQEILPNAVNEGNDGFLSLSYAQVHTAKIAVIEDEVTILKNRVSELETKLQKYDA